MANPQKDFWASVDKSEDCWVWTGRTDQDGYGKYRFKLKEFRAHRWSYALENGEIPPELVVCHHCDNPPCVRPDHLFLGTVADNTRDMIAKGRGRYPGPRTHSPSKATPEVVAEIKQLRFMGATQTEIGKQVGLSQSHVSKILRRSHQ